MQHDVMITLGVPADVAEGGVYSVYGRLAPQISYCSWNHVYDTVKTYFSEHHRSF